MTDYSSNNTRITKNTLFLYIRMILVLLVSLYTTRVILRSLGVVDYGIYNVVAGFVSMFGFLNVSMMNGIQRFYNYSLGKDGQRSIGEAYSAALAIQIVLVVVVFVLLETVGLWLFKNKLIIPDDRADSSLWLYQLSVISLLVVVIQVPYSAAIIAYEKMNFYAYLSIIEVLLKLTIAFVISFYNGDRLLLYGVLMLVATMITCVLFIIYSKTHFEYLKLCKANKSLINQMLVFSGWNILGTFSYMIKGQGLNILLNSFFGPVVNAARGVSSMVSSSIQGFQSNIVLSFRPQLIESYAKGENARVLNLMYSLSKASYVLLYMLSMPVIIELQYILHLWLGDTIPDYTIPFTMLILINMVISSLTTPISQVVHATGKMRLFQVCTSIIIISILPISYLFLTRGGSPVVVYAVSLIITIINQAACLLLLKRLFQFSIRNYARCVLCPLLLITLLAIILPLIIHHYLQESFFRATLVVFSSIIGSSLLYYISLNKQEKGVIISFIRRKINK